MNRSWFVVRFIKLRESIYFATKPANSLYLYSSFDVHSNHLSTFKGYVTGQKIRSSIYSRLVTCLSLDGTSTVNSAFNESVCLLSCMVMFDRPKNSMLRPLPGVNQSGKYLRTFLCHRISFCPFSSSPFLAKRDMPV